LLPHGGLDSGVDRAKAEGVACVIIEACVLTGWVARLAVLLKASDGA